MRARPGPTPLIPGHEWRTLSAGLTFLERAASHQMNADGLIRWFDEHVVPETGMPCPGVVVEPPIGPVALDEAEGDFRTLRIVSAARERVLAALRGLTAQPSDDGFVQDAVYSGRVRRHGIRWRARPEGTAALSDIVLSLFVVSVLTDRGLYRKQLSICGTCGRVTFEAMSSARATCLEHPVHTQPISSYPGR